MGMALRQPILPEAVFQPGGSLIKSMSKNLFGAGLVAELAPMLRYALFLTRDQSAAEDLVQDAIVLACEAQGNFRSGRKLRPWLFSILHNQFISGRRRQHMQRQRLRSIADDAVGHLRPGQEETLRLGALLKAFESLPEDLREVLHLVGIEGMTYREVSAVLAIPLGTVMSRLSRARASLREIEAAPVRERKLADGTGGLRVVGGHNEE